MSIQLILITFVIASAQSTFGDDYPDYNNPIRTSAEDEIKNLPGLNDAVNFRHYSGYLRADDDDRANKYLHYWFAESQSNPTKDPVLLWLNGGPGCSSMGGLFTEVGPFIVNDDSKTLRLNPYSWNKVANVLFLESPFEVGFSYSTGYSDEHTDDTTARENLLALKSFMDKFPQYRNNSLYLAGESYAGVYLPTLGVLADADESLNLRGIAIGNGYLDAAKLMKSLVFFYYHHGFAGKSSWDRMSKGCCNDLPPSPGTCPEEAFSEFDCQVALMDVLSLLHEPGLNPYNIYAKCARSDKVEGISGVENREVVDRALQVNFLKSSGPFQIFNGSEEIVGRQPPCLDDRVVINYMNDRAVREAIHIPERLKDWELCTRLNYTVDYPVRPGGLRPEMKKLIESKRKLSMLVYNGDVDSVCNFLGDEWFVDDLGRKVISDYSMWKVDKQVAGWVKQYDGITFATVRGSGHMVPGDRPRQALKMIETFLGASDRNVIL